MQNELVGLHLPGNIMGSAGTSVAHTKEAIEHSRYGNFHIFRKGALIVEFDMSMKITRFEFTVSSVETCIQAAPVEARLESLITVPLQFPQPSALLFPSCISWDSPLLDQTFDRHFAHLVSSPCGLEAIACVSVLHSGILKSFCNLSSSIFLSLSRMLQCCSGGSGTPHILLRVSEVHRGD